MMSSHNYSIHVGGAELLDRIEPLWKQLREHHAELSPTWRQWLLTGTFEKRKADLIAKSAGGIQVFLVEIQGEVIAYCVSTINGEAAAEIDSLFVTAEHRKRGIGRMLVERTMDWIQSKLPTSIMVGVLAGNDQAMRLYESAGFKPRTTRLNYPM